MSDSVRPHRLQPARLPRPWDSPGTNTGVGCHFLLQCMKVKSESEVAQSCPTLSDPMDCSPPGSSVSDPSSRQGVLPMNHQGNGRFFESKEFRTIFLMEPNVGVFPCSRNKSIFPSESKRGEVKMKTTHFSLLLALVTSEF